MIVCIELRRNFKPTWRSNPQYLIKSNPTKPTKVFIHMSQPDPRLDYGMLDCPLNIGFVIIKGKAIPGLDFALYPRHLEPLTKESLVHQQPAEANRFVSVELMLPPSNDAPFYMVPFNTKVGSCFCTSLVSLCFETHWLHFSIATWSELHFCRHDLHVVWLTRTLAASNVF